MRLSVSPLVLAFAIAACNWIGGSLRAQSPTYVTGYGSPVYVTGQAVPVANSAVTAGTPISSTTYYPGTSYVAGYASSTSFDPNATSLLSSNGTYQAQRPAYFDNPSVYSGLPTLGSSPAYQSLRAPLTDSLRGNATAPMVIENYPVAYSSYYEGSMPGAPLTVATPLGTPPTAIPATTVTPIYPAAPPQSECCLTRFFRKLCGTSYSTSYYRAPVTYYRPVTTVDPVTGLPVVVQQACTSYEQQVQRIPSTTLQFGQGTSSPPSTSCPQGCPTTPCTPGSYGYGAAGVSPSGDYGSVGQVGGYGTTGGVVNIPSIAPEGPSSSQSTSQSSVIPSSPNTAPLIGVPPTSTPGGSNDLAPVNQPRLDAGNTPSIPQSGTESTLRGTTSSQWQLQNPQDSTALIKPRVTLPPTINTNQPPASAPQQTIDSPQQIIDNDNFTRAEPIEAPDDYVAPYRRHTFQSPRTTPVTHGAGGFDDQPQDVHSRHVSNVTAVAARVPSATSHLPSPSQVIRQPQ